MGRIPVREARETHTTYERAQLVECQKLRGSTRRRGNGERSEGLSLYKPTAATLHHKARVKAPQLEGRYRGHQKVWVYWHGAHLYGSNDLDVGFKR
jgi:hypothetical protein